MLVISVKNTLNSFRNITNVTDEDEAEIPLLENEDGFYGRTERRFLPYQKVRM